LAAPLPQFVLDRLVRDSTPNRVIIKQLVEGKKKTWWARIVDTPTKVLILPCFQILWGVFSRF